MLEHLTVALPSSASKDRILSDWTWLIGAQKQPFLLTAAGDAFVQDTSDGSIHFLDVGAGQLIRIADSAQAFEHLLGDRAFVDGYLCPDLVGLLRAKGMVLQPGQIYSYRVPPALGGERTLENIETSSVGVHFSIAGQISRQIAGLPVGTPITNIEIKLPGEKPWWKFW